jgi:hypothetical protein
VKKGDKKKGPKGSALREELRRTVEALENHPELSTHPEIRKLAKQGRKLLDRHIADDRAVDEAEAAYREARKRADEAAKNMAKQLGPRELEAAVAFLIEGGQHDSAATFREMVEHGRKLLAAERRAQKKKKRGGPGGADFS